MSTAQRSLVSDEKHVYNVLRSERFLRMEGLSKEVPFFIYHFRPPGRSRSKASAIASPRSSARMTG